MDADGSHVRQRPTTPALLQRRAVLLTRRQARIFRSDRKRKDFLQIYVINADGTGERALTDEPDAGDWGAVLVQGRQARHLRIPPTTPTRPAATTSTCGG